MITFILVTAFSIALHPWSGTFQRLDIETKTANAQEVQEVPAPSELELRIQKAIAEIPHTSSTTEKWVRYVYEYADEVGGNADRASHLIWCESMYVCGQSGIVKNGKREASFCLGQLHSPSHPHISWEELNDPYYNIRYVIDNAGKDKWWGYNENTDSCASGVDEYWK